MLLGNKNSTASFKEQPKLDSDLVFNLMVTKRYAEAYMLLREAQNRLDDPILLFNYSLCLFYAEQYKDAVYYLDKAYQQAVSSLEYARLNVDASYKLILAKENQDDSYRQPLPKNYAASFNELLKDNILRLKVDCYLMLEEWDVVLELALGLESKQYANITHAIVVARGKK